jgi:hypothetical protein
LKNPENKYHLIPNPETAPIVKRMYALAVSGMGAARIAKALMEEGILNPSAYSTQVLGVRRPRLYTNAYHWHTTSISQIIKNKVYLGHMISQKESSVSFKNKKTIKRSEEECVKVLNTHEPLVEQDEFDIAQKIFRIKNRGNKHGFVNIFVGIVKCSDCGAGLTIIFPASPRKHIYYGCNRYRQFADYCTTHLIRYDDVYRIVLEGIQEKQQFVKAHTDELALYAQKLADRGADIELKQMRSELDKSKKRHGELDILIQKIFEQVALGSIPQERYNTLSATYEGEQKALKEKITVLQEKVSDKGGDVHNIMRFFNLVRKHDEVTELTAAVIHEFIDSVVVYQAEGQRKERTQKVVINFRFIKDNRFNFLTD